MIFLDNTKQRAIICDKLGVRLIYEYIRCMIKIYSKIDNLTRTSCAIKTASNSGVHGLRLGRDCNFVR